MAKALEHTHRGWLYQRDDRQADLNVRVFLEQDVATVGVRISKTPLHDRWYQQGFSQIPRRVHVDCKSTMW
ncbi:MAG: hypothetical protein E6I91_00360 [Chloroflexi bacterium]|nr:MAG: hypothetical protein E6I91_00360 [Chloroflexota bacterium]